MRKTWVKRNEIYYKPFYKQKSKMFLLLIFLLGIIFIIYQAFYINQLPKLSTSTVFEKAAQAQGQAQGQAQAQVQIEVQKLSNQKVDGENEDEGNGEAADEGAMKHISIIRGIRLFNYDAYKPNLENKFRCLDGSKEILYEYVNDNYCDCEMDGSDEPSTNACFKGRFYCKYQKRHITGRGQDVYVPSNRINDGICDCCDGSDEWLTNAYCKIKCDLI